MTTTWPASSSLARRIRGRRHRRVDAAVAAVDHHVRAAVCRARSAAPTWDSRGAPSIPGGRRGGCRSRTLPDTGLQRGPAPRLGHLVARRPAALEHCRARLYLPGQEGHHQLPAGDARTSGSEHPEIGGHLKEAPFLQVWLLASFFDHLHLQVLLLVARRLPPSRRPCRMGTPRAHRDVLRLELVAELPAGDERLVLPDGRVEQSGPRPAWPCGPPRRCRDSRASHLAAGRQPP